MNHAADESAIRSSAINLRALRAWWRTTISDTVDQDAVIAKLRGESELSARYVFMTAMSAAIAILGLLLSSPAVVIGAMLLSPLMGPTLGAGFALAIGDARWLRRCARSLATGILVAILFSALIVLLSPLQTVTDEIASRTRPNLFDLGVAFFSALAGSYAMIRGREGTIVGVAIATAVMPPLAVVGYGLATGNWTVFGGALMLFVTNLLTIALTASVMARIYGFYSTLSPQQTMMQSLGVLASFVILAIPLGASLKQIAWETTASRQIDGLIKDEFAAKARVSQLDIDFDATPIRVAAAVFTPEFQPDATERSRRSLEQALGRQVDLRIEQFRVGTDPRAAEAAQLAGAQAKEQAAATEREVALIGELLALVAGDLADDVRIDRERRRAIVRARPIEGTALSGYWQLERRISASAPDWSIELIPPARPLPEIEFASDGRLSTRGREAIAVIVWAASRLDRPVALSGPAKRVGDLARFLAQEGVRVEDPDADGGPDDRTLVSWSTASGD